MRLFIHKFPLNCRMQKIYNSFALYFSTCFAYPSKYIKLYTYVYVICMYKGIKETEMVNTLHFLTLLINGKWNFVLI